MGNIRIVNLKNYKPVDNEILIKVDRSSPVGNPFYMHDESKRDEVCDRYEKHFAKNILISGSPFNKYINNIIDLVMEDKLVALGCWCYPKRCHAETIVKFVEEVINFDDYI